jgi:large subunit ribosomal protein L18
LITGPYSEVLIVAFIYWLKEASSRMLDKSINTLKLIDWQGGGLLGKGPRYRVPLRRRRKNKTDYRKRKILVTSKTPRFTVRASLKNMNTQVFHAHAKGDITLTTANSRELAEYGWKAHCGNIPAAYLTGLLMGFKAQSKGIDQVNPDIGLKRASLGSRVFAAIKGAVDSGLAVPCGDVLPDESRIKGEHISSYARHLAEAEPELYERRFSKYLSKNLPPEQLPSHFNEVKSNIFQKFKQDM